MKTKQIYILAGILFLLIVGIIFHQYKDRPELATEEYASLDMSFDSSLVAQIQIVKEKAGQEMQLPQVSLVKRSGTWTIPGLWGTRADQSKIDRLLSEIQKAKGELRADSKELFSDFGIADNEGFQVQLLDASGKELLALVIGTRKADFGTLFVRKKGSEKVYLTEANLYGQMGVFGDPKADSVPLDYWSMKNFAFFDQGSIKKIEIKKFKNGNAAGTLALANEKEGWQFLASQMPFKPGPEKVSQYLSEMKSSLAQAVVDPSSPEANFTKPGLVVTLSGDSGSPFEILIGNPSSKDSSVFYLKSSSEPAAFLVSKYALENIDVQTPWFFSDNLLNIDNTKLKKLVVHADKTEMTFEPMVKKWDSLIQYLDGLKNFKILRADSSNAKFGKYWIEALRDGEDNSTVLEFSENPVGDQKDYLMRKKGTTATFAVSEAFFRQLFDNLSRLSEPKK